MNSSQQLADPPMLAAIMMTLRASQCQHLPIVVVASAPGIVRNVFVRASRICCQQRRRCLADGFPLACRVQCTVRRAHWPFLSS